MFSFFTCFLTSGQTSLIILAFPDSVMILLKKYKSEQAEEQLKVGDLWQGSDRLFTTWDGRPMHPDTICRWFPKFLQRYNLPPLPFHGLRQMFMLKQYQQD